MSKLQEWIKSHPVDVRTSIRQGISDRCGLTKAAVTHWANGLRTIPPEQLKNLSAATGIPVADLRPDLAEIFK